jgi:hypothetical protein
LSYRPRLGTTKRDPKNPNLPVMGSFVHDPSKHHRVVKLNQRQSARPKTKKSMAKETKARTESGRVYWDTCYAAAKTPELVIAHINQKLAGENPPPLMPENLFAGVGAALDQTIVDLPAQDSFISNFGLTDLADLGLAEDRSNNLVLSVDLASTVQAGPISVSESSGGNTDMSDGSIYFDILRARGDA